MNLDTIKYRNRESGFHFFEPGTLRFFASRIGRKVYNGPGGVYFVTSEQFRSPSLGNGPRRYSVRRFNPETGACDTVGPFQAYRTAGEAGRVAARLATPK